jgi:hypothetical protein
MTSTVKQNSPCGLVLNTEKMTVKLNKDIIVTNKTIDGKEMLADVRDMKDIIQF